MAQRDTRMTIGMVAKVLLWAIYVWVIVNLVLLFLAFTLLLLGANPDAGFAEWVYRSTERSMAPFRGLFEPVVYNGESVLDTSLLFAMIIYSLVALFLRAAIDWVTDLVARRNFSLEQQARAADVDLAATPSPAMRPEPAAPPPVR